MSQEFLNFDDAMKFLGIKSYKTLGDLIKAGLPIVVVGNSKKISKTSLIKFMKEHEVTANQS